MLKDKLDKTYILARASTCEADTAQIKADTNALDIDLMRIDSILFSIGKNKNDDVFIPSEVMPIVHTGANKPLNLEHDPDKIVGHMLKTYPVNKDGSLLQDGKPKDYYFDVMSESVFYKALFPEVAKEVKKAAGKSQLFVSVECWFTHYDYLVGNKIVARNKETASVLDPVLKRNKGTGSFEGQPVGRVLRNLIIGGIGLVKNPANPDSIIKSVSTNLDNMPMSNDSETYIVSNFEFNDVYNIENNLIKANIISNLIEDKAKPEDKMRKDFAEEISQLLTAQKVASISPAKTEVTKVSEINDPNMKIVLERIEALEKHNKELNAKIVEEQVKAETIRRSKALLEIGLNESIINKYADNLMVVDSSKFDSIVNIIKDSCELVKSELTKEIAQKTQPKQEVKPEKIEVKQSKVENTAEDDSDAIDLEDLDKLESIDKVDQNISIQTDDKTDEQRMRDIFSGIVKNLFSKK